jgi:coenzyme F420-reducing hydrogenase alpha subunit
MKHGAFVYRRNEAADGLYVLVEGMVLLVRPGAPRALGLNEGHVFGEDCLLEGATRAVDVRVNGRMLALRIPKEALDRAVVRHSTLGDVLFDVLVRRLVTNALQTPRTQVPLERLHANPGCAPNNMTLHTNWARTIEVLHAAELIDELLRDPDLQKQDLIVTPAPGAWVGEGVGVVEAPRGTLLHHYRASPEGDITFANLIVATTHNNQVLNLTVRSVAEDYLVGRGEITEAMMNAIEVGIRAFDPCLSCATHAFGQMPLIVTVRDPAGNVINERVRSAPGP